MFVELRYPDHRNARVHPKGVLADALTLASKKYKKSPLELVIGNGIGRFEKSEGWYFKYEIRDKE